MDKQCRGGTNIYPGGRGRWTKECRGFYPRCGEGSTYTRENKKQYN